MNKANYTYTHVAVCDRESKYIGIKEVENEKMKI